MKIRQSGMPEETYWESFFVPQYIFSRLGLDKSITDAAEFGSGYGTFTIPAARIISGKLYAFDIDEFMIERLQNRANENKLTNIKSIYRDFVKDGTGLKDESVDFVMLFNILHHEEPVYLLNETHRILKKNGKAGIIHWIFSSSTPRGPSLDIRPKPEQCIDWLNQTGFWGNEIISLPPYHYGVVGVKT